MTRRATHTTKPTTKPTTTTKRTPALTPTPTPAPTPARVFEVPFVPTARQLSEIAIASKYRSVQSARRCYFGKESVSEVLHEAISDAARSIGLPPPQRLNVRAHRSSSIGRALIAAAAEAAKSSTEQTTPPPSAA